MVFSSSAIHKTSSIDAHFARIVIIRLEKQTSVSKPRRRFCYPVFVLHHPSRRYGWRGHERKKHPTLSRRRRFLLNMTSLDQTIRVEPSDCCGLIGPNGCGKSSLLKAIGGLIEHDSGDCVIAQNVQLGYLEQTGTSGSTLTVYKEATSKMETLNRLKKMLQRWRRVRIRERRGGSERPSGMGKSGRR